MFGIDSGEFLVIMVVAIIVIGPKDLPVALRTAGRWIAQMRRISGHFRSGLDAMIREAEMEELEKKWAEQNAKIMAEHPQGVEEGERTGAWPAPRMEPLAGPPLAEPSVPTTSGTAAP